MVTGSQLFGGNHTNTYWPYIDTNGGGKDFVWNDLKPYRLAYIDQVSERENLGYTTVISENRYKFHSSFTARPKLANSYINRPQHLKATVLSLRPRWKGASAESTALSWRLVKFEAKNSWSVLLQRLLRLQVRISHQEKMRECRPKVWSINVWVKLRTCNHNLQKNPYDYLPGKSLSWAGGK